MNGNVIEYLHNIPVMRQFHSLNTLIMADCEKLITQHVARFTFFNFIFTFFQDENLVYVKDLSGNGTWVDDEIIGNGKQRLLSNNSVIALAEQKHQG